MTETGVTAITELRPGLEPGPSGRIEVGQGVEKPVCVATLIYLVHD